MSLFQKNKDLNNPYGIYSSEIPKKHGIYSKEERLKKIQKYKEKKQKWRAKHPINRGFIGRKLVAKAKPRVRGKFVKKPLFESIEEMK